MKLKVLKKQNKNDLSLRTRFYAVEGDLMVGVVAGRDEHQSYPNRMHGGLITALLDEVIGRAVNIPEPDAFGVTSEINVKFKKPVPLNEEIKVVGRTRNTRLIFTAEGFIEDKDGNILATGKATYVKMSAARIAGKPMGADEWFLVPDDEAEIDVVNYDYFDKEDAARK